ncbi:MAG: ornithine cyclodeaminase family protein [Candidatus Dormibacteraeota bacterium]|nr:ornithine cyclodeaminase family protein [Candidatus Dormibacteraeota bacterium]
MKDGAIGRGLLFLSQAEVTELLDPDHLLESLAQGFIEASAGQTSVPPRVAARTPVGMLAAMPGFIPSAGLVAKLVSVFPANHGTQVPSHQALIALFDDRDGRALAVMDGTRITALRTAAAAALATRLLARPEARNLAILGAGVQGSTHLEMLPRVRDFAEIRVASRNLEHAAALAALHPRARAAETFEAAARGADVVCCCTDSPDPVVDRAWLGVGAHVTSVGYSSSGAELDPATVRAARLFVESRDAFAPPPAGAVELAGLDPALGTELGEVLSGVAPGRRDGIELTLYKSMGHALEDAVAARLVYDRALAVGAGARLPV